MLAEKALNKNPRVISNLASLGCSSKVPETPMRRKVKISPCHSDDMEYCSAILSAIFCAAALAFFGDNLCFFVMLISAIALSFSRDIEVRKIAAIDSRAASLSMQQHKFVRHHHQKKIYVITQ